MLANDDAHLMIVICFTTLGIYLYNIIYIEREIERVFYFHLHIVYNTENQLKAALDIKKWFPVFKAILDDDTHSLKTYLMLLHSVSE